MYAILVHTRVFWQHFFFFSEHLIEGPLRSILEYSVFFVKNIDQFPCLCGQHRLENHVGRSEGQRACDLGKQNIFKMQLDMPTPAPTPATIFWCQTILTTFFLLHQKMQLLLCTHHVRSTWNPLEMWCEYGTPATRVWFLCCYWMLLGPMVQYWVAVILVPQGRDLHRWHWQIQGRWSRLFWLAWGVDLCCKNWQHDLNHFGTCQRNQTTFLCARMPMQPLPSSTIPCWASAWSLCVRNEIWRWSFWQLFFV